MRHLLIAAVFLSLIACSSDKKEEATGVIPEHQLQALEKAKQTEDLLKKEKEEMDKKIQDASE